jgi:DNA-binding HxlR family transcriptional regulator
VRRPRGYGESCPVAHALDLIGDRWALLVVRELRLGPRRFADLSAALPAIGPTTLTQRLRDLAAIGVLAREGGGRSASYRLTEWGADLEPVFGALARWGIRSPVVPLSGPISDDAMMTGVRTFVAGATPARPAPQQVATIDLRLKRESYRLEVADGRLVGLRRITGARSLPPAAAILETESATVQALVTGRLTATAAAAQVEFDGDRRLGRWLLGLLTPKGREAAPQRR